MRAAAEHLRQKQRLVVAAARTVQDKDRRAVAPDGHLNLAMAGVDQLAARRKASAQAGHVGLVGDGDGQSDAKKGEREDQKDGVAHGPANKVHLAQTLRQTGVAVADQDQPGGPWATGQNRGHVTGKGA